MRVDVADLLEWTAGRSSASVLARTISSPSGAICHVVRIAGEP